MLCMLLQDRKPCLHALSGLGREFSEINIYDVYVDYCLSGNRAAALRLSEASGYHPGLLGPWAAAQGMPCVAADLLIRGWGSCRA